MHRRCRGITFQSPLGDGRKEALATENSGKSQGEEKRYGEPKTGLKDIKKNSEIMLENVNLYYKTTKRQTTVIQVRIVFFSPYR